MNHDCNGDFYSIDGERWYRCLLDSTILNVAEDFKDKSTCPRCERPIVAEDHGEVATREFTTVEFHAAGQWYTHSVCLSPINRAEMETVPAPAACSITEYDGAYRCTTHGRTWGAVTNPDQPCEGCQCDIPVPAMDDKTCARIAELENVLRQARGYLINAAKGRTHWDGCDHPECVILREIDSLNCETGSHG